jgi:hypothetical protein
VCAASASATNATANSAEAWFPNDLCGRAWLQSTLRQTPLLASPGHALEILQRQELLAQPTMKALGVTVLPETADSTYNVSTPTCASQRQIKRDMNSEPLPEWGTLNRAQIMALVKVAARLRQRQVLMQTQNSPCMRYSSQRALCGDAHGKVHESIP